MNEQTRPRRGRRWAGWIVAAALVVAGLALAAVVWGPRLLNSLDSSGASATPAVVDNTSPEALAERRAQELAWLNSYGWVDPEAEIAHIPIERAIALVAESGLPVGEPAAAADAEPDEGQDAGSEEMPSVDLATVNYQDHVLPIFEARCGECHGAEDPEEGLELTRYRTALVGSQNGPVIEPGDPEGSYLVELIVEGKMPKDADPLPQQEIDIIIAWIEAGAPETAPEDAAPSEDAPTEEAAPPIDPETVSFQDHVLPIFEQHCAECHGAEDPEEQLEVTNYRTLMMGSQNGPVIEPGDPEGSYLVEMVVEGKMPKDADPLSQREIDTIIAWIKAGALDN